MYFSFLTSIYIYIYVYIKFYLMWLLPFLQESEERLRWWLPLYRPHFHPVAVFKRQTHDLLAWLARLEKGHCDLRQAVRDSYPLLLHVSAPQSRALSSASAIKEASVEDVLSASLERLRDMLRATLRTHSFESSDHVKELNDRHDDHTDCFRSTSLPLVEFALSLCALPSWISVTELGIANLLLF